MLHHCHTIYDIYTIYGMRVVYEHRRVPRQIRGLPQDILKRYEKWKDIVAISGPNGLRLIKGFHDESLRGEWIRSPLIETWQTVSSHISNREKSSSRSSRKYNCPRLSEEMI